MLALRVRSARSALAFVNDVGMCSTFYRFPEGVPCLWEAVVGRSHPRWPRHSHHDDGVGLTWRIKDELPAARRVYYGKLLKRRPMLVALDIFPAFYALTRGRQRARDYRLEYEAGRLSHTARRLMDALTREHPQYTRELRGNTFLLEPRKTREFERAMAELQQGLWVVKSEERYEPTFSYRWDLLEAWLPDAVAEGRRLSRAAALEQLLERYLDAAVFTSPGALAGLFGLGRVEVADAVAPLTRRGAVMERVVEGWPGRWLIASSALRLRSPAAGAAERARESAEPAPIAQFTSLPESSCWHAVRWADVLMATKKKRSGRKRANVPRATRPRRSTKEGRAIAERSARRDVPEEALQGPPARETTFIRDDRERAVEAHREGYHDTSPKLTGGDPDADWERADHVGEEAVGGTVATPDQSVVDDLGGALGVPRAPDEEVRTSEEILEGRDRHRWEQEIGGGA